MENQNKYILICLGSPWDDRQRRNYQIMTRLSKWKNIEKVVYIESWGPLNLWSYIKYIFKKTEQYDTVRWKYLLNNGLIRNTGNLSIVSPIAIIPFISIPLILKLNLDIFYFTQIFIIKQLLKKLKSKNIILWITHSYDTSRFIGKFNEKLICYDLCDDYNTFQPKKSMWGKIVRKNDDIITQSANIIFVVSKMLYKSKKIVNHNVYLMPNGVDMNYFTNSKGNSNNSMELASMQHPIIGYVGIISDRINFDILEYIAVNKTEWSIAIIGPIEKVVFDKVNSLKDHSNIFFLGEKPHLELPYYLNEMDVCIIPHLSNEKTMNMDPIKLHEYLAIGKPVISTPIGGVERFTDVVEVAETKAVFLNCIEFAIKNDNEQLVMKRTVVASNNSWNKRVEEIRLIIENNIS